MADEFMRAVATIAADDAELRADLKDSEDRVRHSVDSMQGDFDRLSVGADKGAQSFDNLSGSANDAGIALSGFSRVASISGSEALSGAASVGELVYALQVMGDASLGAVRQLGAYAVSAGAILLPVIGITAAIATLGVAFTQMYEAASGVSLDDSVITRLFRKFTDWEVGLKDSEAVGDRLTGQLEAQAEQTAKMVKSLEQQRAMLLGAKASEFAPNVAVQEAMIALEQTQERIKKAAEDEARTRRELAATMADEAAMAERKQRAIEATARAIQMEERAKLALIEAQGPQSAMEASIAVREAQTLVEAGIRGTQLLAKAFAEFTHDRGLGQDAADRLSAFLGLPRAVPAAASPARGAGVSSGAFAFGFAASGGGSTQAKSEAIAERTAKATEQVAVNTKATQESVKKMEGGLN